MRKLMVPLVLATGFGLFGLTINQQELVGRSASFWSLKIFQQSSVSLLVPKHGDLFTPGSLQMNKSETLRRCYMDPHRYKNHMRKRSTCSFSNEYMLVYHMVAKAGSSTARTIMKESFNATENACMASNDNDAYFRFTFVRNPFSRFISSYQEMVKRIILSEGIAMSLIPEQYGSFLAAYPTKSSVGNMTEDERTLAFLQFVHVYDAAIPFDGHLRLQTPRLVKHDGRGRALDLDSVVDTHDMDDHWISMAKCVQAPLPPEAGLRANPGRTMILNVTTIDPATRRKICQLSALDYCCLNYPLPPECMPQHGDDESSLGGSEEAIVQCRWVMKPGTSNQLMIEDVSPYPPLREY
jgi:hypothetical protein